MIRALDKLKTRLLAMFDGPRAVRRTLAENVVFADTPGVTGAMVERVFVAVESFVQDNVDVCWPSVEKLAERAKCSRSSVYRALARLYEWGVLSWSGGRGYYSNRYRVSWWRAAEVGTRDRRPGWDEDVPDAFELAAGRFEAATSRVKPPKAAGGKRRGRQRSGRGPAWSRGQLGLPLADGPADAPPDRRVPASGPDPPPPGGLTPELRESLAARMDAHRDRHGLRRAA